MSQQSGLTGLSDCWKQETGYCDIVNQKSSESNLRSN